MFLPLYFQTVDLASPTEAGLRLVPMIVGLLTTSILSGQLISRTGRYRDLPDHRHAADERRAAAALAPGRGHSSAASALYLLVLGLGLGSTMQVLVLAVQNAVDYRGARGGDLGRDDAARNRRLARHGHVRDDLLDRASRPAARRPARAARAQVSHGGAAHRRAGRASSAPARGAYQHAYVHSLRPVFVMAAGVAALGFVLSLFLQERALRGAAGHQHGPRGRPRGAALARLAGRDRALADARHDARGAPALPRASRRSGRAWSSAPARPGRWCASTSTASQRARALAPSGRRPRRAHRRGDRASSPSAACSRGRWARDAAAHAPRAASTPSAC